MLLVRYFVNSKRVSLTLTLVMGMGSVLCKVKPYDEEISKTRDLGWAFLFMDISCPPNTPGDFSNDVCVCVWIRVGLRSRFCSIGVKRGPTQRLSVCSVVHLSKAPLIITFFWTMFLSQLNWTQAARFLLIVIVTIFTNLQSWIILISTYLQSMLSSTHPCVVCLA
jgi:hypothetical protein